MSRLSGSALKYACRYAAAAERARARIRFLGLTPRGSPLWTSEEDALLRACYPNYQLAIKRLKRRTYYACRARARHLRLVAPRPLWTAAGVSRLRRIYPTATPEELIAAFPERGLANIQKKGRTQPSCATQAARTDSHTMASHRRHQAARAAIKLHNVGIGPGGWYRELFL